MAQGNSERFKMKSPKSPDTGLTDSEQKTPNCGKAKFKSCPTPPSMPPSWKTVQSIIKNHQISKTFPMILNFECSAMPPNVGFPEKIAYRPSSICTMQLIVAAIHRTTRVDVGSSALHVRAQRAADGGAQRAGQHGPLQPLRHARRSAETHAGTPAPGIRCRCDELLHGCAVVRRGWQLARRCTHAASQRVTIGHDIGQDTGETAHAPWASFSTSSCTPLSMATSLPPDTPAMARARAEASVPAKGRRLNDCRPLRPQSTIPHTVCFHLTGPLSAYTLPDRPCRAVSFASWCERWGMGRQHSRPTSTGTQRTNLRA